MLAPPPRSGRRPALLKQSPTFKEERDRVQHHIVAAVAYKDDPRLVFKGGTMLRVCGLPDYRYSEDLDFDWVGTPREFHTVLNAAVNHAAWSSGVDLTLAIGRGPNPSILWRGDRAGKRIKAEAAFVSSHDLPIRRWPIRPNHPDIPPAPPIRGYRFVSVMADKLSCISRRVAARDFYDLNSLLTRGEDIHAAWDLYVAIADHPERQYGRRPHPSDIRASYLGRRSAIAADWEESVADSLLPPASFTEAFTNVDNAVQTALGRWKQRLGPGELHRLKQEHQQQPRGRSLDIGL